jgi:antitoxin (DNA-binding transcriptional repressor) of toxin-antitoxin stability system
MITVSIGEAGRRFEVLLHLVQNERECIEVEDAGKPVARIIPAAEPLTGRALAEAWRKLPHLDTEEANALEADLVDLRAALPSVKSKWD